MHPYNTMGVQPGHAGYAPRGAAQMVHAPNRVGRGYYDLVGVDAEPGMWDKIKIWGDEETLSVKNKYWVGAAVVVGVAWYGYYAGWFGR